MKLPKHVLAAAASSYLLSFPSETNPLASLSEREIWDAMFEDYMERFRLEVDRLEALTPEHFQREIHGVKDAQQPTPQVPETEGANDGQE